MSPEFRFAVIQFILSNDTSNIVVQKIDYDPVTAKGRITYTPTGVWIDPAAPGFSVYSTQITDEELVRAYLLVRLTTAYGYIAKPEKLEIERVYKSVGRPGKGGRVDLVVRNRSNNDAFLFVECKEPNKFDSDLKLIDGQLFRLSRQESRQPKNLLYFTVELRDGALRERVLLINTAIYSNYDDWDKAGQPIIDAIPTSYGIARKRPYANVISSTSETRPLEYSTGSKEFSRLRNELHDVIWGGGGTNNNEVFVYITKLILCKIYDEQETEPNKEYRFQRFGDADAPEDVTSVAARMNALYREAETSYLALSTTSVGPAFDSAKISAQKIAYVVGRLEGISVINNTHGGDLLGEFFEQIVSQDFTQSKGQFFTPPKIVRFMLKLVKAGPIALEVMRTKKDHLGRPRLPFVIDPSCGSGTFLIEYMKEVTWTLAKNEVRLSLPARIREMHDVWFGGRKQNIWAKDFLFGVENNYDLGLASKVNMVLHGDGSMNTWIKNGLLPFNNYWVDGRHNVLGTASTQTSKTSYSLPTNEQFDLVLSNPPFSLTMSPDERSLVETAFGDSLRISEQLFIERWYQLLREGGEFCCILPEAVLDTSTNRSTRLFLIKHFEILAVISLPYDAFKPFTSTKTCIIFARKRSHTALIRWNKAWSSQADNDEHHKLQRVITELGYDKEILFMAEPFEIGYKRRKNLSDLIRHNQLYQETTDGLVAGIDINSPKTVLDYYFSSEQNLQDPQLGFRVTLGQLATRQGLRLDPKYAWLWIKEKGLILGRDEHAVRLGEFLRIVDLQKLKKGELQQECLLIDLEQVEGRTGVIIDDTRRVDEIGSDKVSFSGAELVFSKLEPYLGKFIIDPPQDAIGSTEWVGLARIKPLPLLYLAHLMMHQKLCDAYRRLQSGKRHARLEPDEMLELRVEVKNLTDAEICAKMLAESRLAINKKKEEIYIIRAQMENVVE